MPVTVTIPTITTEDAHPTVAPHRISRDPTHTTLAAPFTPTHDGFIVPSGSLVPSSGMLWPTTEMRPSRGLRPGNSASHRPSSGRPPLYPDTGLYPDMDATVPTNGTDPLDPGFTPGGSVYPSPGTFLVHRRAIGYVVREGGVSALTGRCVAQKGIRAGAGACSATRRVCSSTDWSSLSGAQVPLSFTFADADDGGADGTRQITVYVALPGQAAT